MFFICFQIGISRALSALAPLKVDLDDAINAPPIGRNPGHELCIDEVRAASKKLYEWRSYMDKMSPQKKTKEHNMNDDVDMNKSSFKLRNINRKNKNDANDTGYNGKYTNNAVETDNAVRVDGNHLFVITRPGESNQTDRNDQNFAWID